MTEDNTGKPAPLAASAFQNVLNAFARAEVLHEGKTEQENAISQLEAVRRMIEHHIPEKVWRERLHHALDAARQGKHEVELLRFPAKQCSDGGHAINVGDAEKWPATLTGEAADLYRVWLADLHPGNFQLKARILEYPHGNFGDAGLILSWAQGG